MTRLDKALTSLESTLQRVENMDCVDYMKSTSNNKVPKEWYGDEDNIPLGAQLSFDFRSNDG